jgi:hypothetical protein
MLLDGDGIVGTLGAIYSDQLIEGRIERFCNLAHWCVIESFRQHSTALAIKLLNQKNCHFTNLTPLPLVEKTLSFLKFKMLEDRHLLIAVPPNAVAFSQIGIYQSDEHILQQAPPDLKKTYLDHRGVSGLHHMLAGHPGSWLYLAFRHTRIKHLKGAQILQSSDSELFSRYLNAVCRYLLVRRGIFVIRSDNRFLAERPRLSVCQPLRVPTLYRSETLRPAQVGNLYSELVAS